jgi:hypothetical protein
LFKRTRETAPQRGDAKKSRATLSLAQKRTRQLPTLENSGGGWFDWAVNDLLRREAETLIVGKKAELGK